MEKVYYIEKEIINNYNDRNRNYLISLNLNEIFNNNHIIEDLKSLCNENDMTIGFSKILDIYNKINNIRIKTPNEIKLTLKVEKKEVKKPIRFISKMDLQLKIIILKQN